MPWRTEHSWPYLDSDSYPWLTQAVANCCIYSVTTMKWNYSFLSTAPFNPIWSQFIELHMVYSSVVSLLFLFGKGEWSVLGHRALCLSIYPSLFFLLGSWCTHFAIFFLCILPKSLHFMFGLCLFPRISCHWICSLVSSSIWAFLSKYYHQHFLATLPPPTQVFYYISVSLTIMIKLLKNVDWKVHIVKHCIM